MRALIVDDSLEIREITAAYLTAAGYPEPAKAADAETALTLLGIDSSGIASDGAASAEAVDVVLMDIMMPGMDGIEACARIKRNGRTAEIPVLMVSSRDDNTALQQAFLAGASDYVRKPIERVELLARIRSALRLKAELERRRGQEQALRAELARLGSAHAAAAIDPATGLPSMIVGAAFAESALAAGRPVAAAMLVPDGLMTHAGNAQSSTEVLRAVADAAAGCAGGLGDLLVAGPVAGRLLLVARDRSPAELAALGERVRLAVERARIAGRGNDATVTVSVGIATAAGDPAGWPALLDAVGRAAMLASARGGNRIELAARAQPDELRRGSA